jgi:CPA2 family monovalent cation:H+ antiporter-2
VTAGGGVDATAVLATLGELGVFIVVALVIGLLLVPRLVDFVASFKSNEMLLVTVLGLCFGFSLVVVKMGYSIALGAFLIGAVVAEARHLAVVEHIVEPVRDLFSAVFFVSVGLMLDPKVLVEYSVPIAVITLAVVFGKVVSCGLGAFFAGNDGRTSMKVGMTIAQIGEFSFIIAALGTTRQVTSDFLYPIAVAVSAVTTLLTPYLIRSSDTVASAIERAAPASLVRLMSTYGDWLRGLQFQGDRAAVLKMVRRILVHVSINATIVVALFLSGSYLAGVGAGRLPARLATTTLRNTVLWSAALLLSLPFLIAIYRKVDALSLLLAEVAVAERGHRARSVAVRRLVSRVIPLASLAALALLLAALSATILPPFEVLIFVVVIAVLLTVVFRQSFIRLHARLQVALVSSMAGDAKGH